MTRLDTVEVTVPGTYQDRRYSADQVITVFEGRRDVARDYQTASFGYLPSVTVYYTALRADTYAVLTARTTSGVTEAIPGLYLYQQTLPDGVGDFVAIWDVGDPADYAWEYIVSDT